MKKVIVFYISEFGGHNRAAKNIREALLHRNPDMGVLVMNGLAYFYPYWEKIIDFLYTAVIKHIPHLWGKMYDRKSVVKRLNPVRKLVNQRTFKKLKCLISTYQPDCFVATQAFPCGVVADFKERTGSKLPLIAVVTDYHPHRFWIHPSVDMYIVACNDARQVLVQQGINEKKIKILGIPISCDFLTTHSPQQICQKMGFVPHLPSVLIMGGGLGIGPLEKVAQHLDRIDLDIQFIVICGRNKKLFRWFKKSKNKFRKPIFYYSYIQCVHEIMDFVDIIITKGGGITISEALAKGLAIIITKPIPGQEERNVQFLLRQKAVLQADTPEEIEFCIQQLIHDKERMLALKSRAKEISFIDSSLQIADLVLKLLQ